MPRKIQSISALFAFSLLGIIPVARVNAQTPPAVPAAPVSPATLNRLFNEAEAAFGAKQYDTAVSKIQELLVALGPRKDAPLELLYFNIGLGYLLGEKPAEAEAAFTDCLKRFPKGEYASRCYLGVGRACILQNTPEKKERAIEALKIAALEPKFRSEAGLWLGEVYTSLDRHEEALAVFRSLMGSDIRSPQQTMAAVQVIGLLADSGKLEDLVLYLDRLINQAGVRDALAWYTNQMIVRGDELVGNQKAQDYQSALAIYRSIPSRNEIMEIQKTALESQRRDLAILEKRVAFEKDKPLNQRSNASELIGAIKPAVELSEVALKAIEDKPTLDAALLMRRGRCLYYLDRHEEALVCFRTIRTKFGTAEDAKAAAYAEIIIYNKLKDIAQLDALCTDFLRKYPTAENAEQVATLAGEIFVQKGDWAKVRTFYTGLIKDFPKSESIDRYTFFQGLAYFQDADFKQAMPIFDAFLKNYPNSQMFETAMYYVAMGKFLSNDYKGSLASIKEYLSKFPDGRYAGDLRYRLAFIDSNDKDVDQSDKLIRDLTSFMSGHPDDPATGSMLCLVGDPYKKKKSDKRDELAKFQRLALEAYKKAVWSDSPEDVIQYALDSATSLLQENKDWAGIAALHTEFLQKKPDSSMALLSVSWIIKGLAREGKSEEAAEIVANTLKSRIGNPASEQVEYLIDELVKTMIPKKKPNEINLDEIDAKLIAVLNKAVAGKENATTSARIFYARARLAELLKKRDVAERYLKGIAASNAQNAAALSPALLTVCGEILLKEGKLDEAEAMFRRLVDRYKDGLFSDAGPVGLGYIALARKKPDEALKIFETALETNPGTSRFKETTLGKIEALIGLGRLEDAEKFALQIVGDKMFRGESAGKAYLLLGSVYRKQAEKEAGVDARIALYGKAYGTYQRLCVAYKGTPEIAAEAYWQAYETANAMGKKTEADEMLNVLKTDEKLKNSARYKKVMAEGL